MITDKYFGEHSTNSSASVAAFEEAVFAVAAHRPALEAMKACLGADENLVAGLALKGLGLALLGKAEDFANSRAYLGKVRSAIKRVDGGTGFESTLAEALEFASRGQMKAAAGRLEARVQNEPQDFLCLKLANAFRFMNGEPEKMLSATSKTLSAVGPQHPAYGFILGLHAFGLEETGAFAAAEQIGRLAVRYESADAWAVHAVAHVMEMDGRTGEGAHWLARSRPLWPLCNNFGFHLAWHLALFQIEEGQSDAALDLYDREIRPAQTDDFRDMANAVSMLWRLEQLGVDVGDRWHGLREIAFNRRTDTSYVFASLHYLLALIGAGDRDGAVDLVENLRLSSAANDDEDQARVADEVGIAVAEAILCLHGGKQPGKSFGELALELNAIGGSRAQRDVFMRTLMLSAAESGAADAYAAVRRLRCLLKREDRFARLADAQLAQSLSQHIGSSQRHGLGARSA